MNVYLFGNKEFGFYKVGVTRRETRARSKEIQENLPFYLEEFTVVHMEQSQHAFIIEDEVLAKFGGYRCRGEWLKNVDAAVVSKFIRERAKYYNG